MILSNACSVKFDFQCLTPSSYLKVIPVSALSLYGLFCVLTGLIWSENQNVFITDFLSDGFAQSGIDAASKAPIQRKKFPFKEKNLAITVPALGLSEVRNYFCWRACPFGDVAPFGAELTRE